MLLVRSEKYTGFARTLRHWFTEWGTLVDEDAYFADEAMRLLSDMLAEVETKGYYEERWWLWKYNNKVWEDFDCSTIAWICGRRGDAVSEV